MSFFRRYKLQIKAKTWAKEANGLYDHEDTQINSQDLAIKKPCNISRLNHAIIKEKAHHKSFSTENAESSTDIAEEPVSVAKITSTPVGIKVERTSDEKDIEKAFWKVVGRGKDASGMLLEVGDVIRLGRTIFKLIKMKITSDEPNVKDSYQNSLMNSITNIMEKEDAHNHSLKKIERVSTSSAVCRICLSDSTENDSPFISPCNCTGSVEYVHLECLRLWIKSRLETQHRQNVLTLLWKNLHCELCKQKFPLSFLCEGEELPLVTINDSITGSYAILESFSRDNDSVGIHVIDFGQSQEIKIGRGSECEMKVHDISVSRVHASLAISKGKLYVKDHISKFGTLVLQKDPIIINDDYPKSCWMQCGRTMFIITLKKTWFSWLPCAPSGFNMSKSTKIRESPDHYKCDRPTQLPYNVEEEDRRSIARL